MRKLLTTLALLGALGCGSGSGPNPAPENVAVVVVKNQAFDLMRVYAIEGNSSTPARIGEVEAGQTRRLLVRVHPGIELRFMFSPLGGSKTWVTDAVLLNPGAVLELHIENYLPFSAIFQVRA